MNVLRVGRELTNRGHTFVWITSDSQPSSKKVLETEGFERLQVLQYKALNETITHKQLSRNDKEVRQLPRQLDLLQKPGYTL